MQNYLHSGLCCAAALLKMSLITRMYVDAFVITLLLLLLLLLSLDKAGCLRPSDLRCVTAVETLNSSITDRSRRAVLVTCATPICQQHQSGLTTYRIAASQPASWSALSEFLRAYVLPL